jgi:MFS family permease
LALNFPKIKNAFRALSHRNYRLFFIGQGLSVVGTWMQNIALAWLVYRLTNSVFLLGLVGFSSQIMIFIFSPFAGVIADRFNRHRLIILTQTLALLQAVVLTLLVYANLINVWEIIVLSVFLGFIMSFDAPLRQSFLVEMIDDRKDLGNAIALNSTLFNGARLVGPAIAGVAIASLGEGFCFLLNSISYLAVIFSLLMMKLKHVPKPQKESQVLHEMKEGFAYAYRFPPIRYVILLLGSISLIGMPYAVLMPVFARDILHGGPQTLGLLVGMAGVGALFGAGYLASRKNVIGLTRIIPVAASIFSLGLIIFSFSTVLWFSLVTVTLLGFGMMLHMASSNTLLQTVVDEDKRGRVMSLYTMAFLGLTPFGSLLTGSLASRIGVQLTLALCGLLCLFFAFCFTFLLPEIRRTIRPVYIKMGILPEEVNTAIQTASQLAQVTEKE